MHVFPAIISDEVTQVNRNTAVLNKTRAKCGLLC